MKNINWGIIGCGDVTEVKSGPAFYKLDGSSLHMVMRRNEQKLKSYAMRHHVAKYTTDYKELLADNEIDAVYIATPPNMHCQYTVEAAKHKKAVYVEKPMATNIADCEKMMAACRENGVPLYVAYYRRGQEKFKYIKKLMQDEAIGRVLSYSHIFSCLPVAFNPERAWLMNPDVAGEGLLFDIGSHMVDIAAFIFGDVKTAQGASRKSNENPGISETAGGILQHQSGVQGCVQLTFCSHVQKDEFEIIGERGRVAFAVMSNEPVLVEIDGAQKVVEFAPIEHVQMPYIAEVMEDMRGSGQLDSTGAYGLQTQRVLEVLGRGSEWKT